MQINVVAYSPELRAAAYRFAVLHFEFRRDDEILCGGVTNKCADKGRKQELVVFACGHCIAFVNGRDVIQRFNREVAVR
jgi:hypothetical protein